MAKANIPLPKPKETRDDNDHQDVSVSVENASEHTGFVQALRLILYLIVFIALAGKFLTGSYVWEYEGKWIRLRTYFPPPQRLFTESELAKYDGMDPDKPVYLGIDGDVYDVTKGKAYQPGGPYHVLTGVDAARAFGTGCFKTHRTHDLRALSDAEIKGIRHWKKFYENHPNYFKVGRVLHPPIDPSSPIIEGCDTKNKNKSGAKKDTAERRALVQERDPNTHQEF
ncbi:cytochrome b5-like heme/steroid binding domain-containing protein [Lentinula edodes]|nr:cytochrome b5-like heme/steroid binding domain-containing protein [Lentinula edodes]